MPGGTEIFHTLFLALNSLSGVLPPAGYWVVVAKRGQSASLLLFKISRREAVRADLKKACADPKRNPLLAKSLNLGKVSHCELQEGG
jgi:hypothetical protein